MKKRGILLLFFLLCSLLLGCSGGGLEILGTSGNYNPLIEDSEEGLLHMAWIHRSYNSTGATSAQLNFRSASMQTGALSDARELGSIADINTLGSDVPVTDKIDLAVSKRNVYVVASSRVGEILLFYSHDNGANFRVRTSINSSISSRALFAKVAAKERHVVLAWIEGSAGGPKTIHAAVSSDRGLSFSAGTVLSNLPTETPPSIEISSDGKVWVGFCAGGLAYVSKGELSTGTFDKAIRLSESYELDCKRVRISSSDTDVYAAYLTKYPDDDDYSFSHAILVKRRTTDDTFQLYFGDTVYEELTLRDLVASGENVSLIYEDSGGAILATKSQAETLHADLSVFDLNGRSPAIAAVGNHIVHTFRDYSALSLNGRSKYRISRSGGGFFNPELTIDPHLDAVAMDLVVGAAGGWYAILRNRDSGTGNYALFFYYRLGRT